MEEKRMKKLVALLLTLALCLGAASALADGFAPIAKEDIKIGVILLHDENSTYDLNFMNGANEAKEALGLSDDQVVFYRNQPESNDCAEAALDAPDS